MDRVYIVVKDLYDEFEKQPSQHIEQAFSNSESAIKYVKSKGFEEDKEHYYDRNKSWISERIEDTQYKISTINVFD